MGLTGQQPTGPTREDIDGYVRRRASILLGNVSPKRLLGKAFTPFDAPALECTNVAATLGPSATYPGRWFATANASNNLLLLSRPSAFVGGYHATMAGDDTETGWYAAVGVSFIDAPDADFDLGLYFRNQSTGAQHAFLGLRAASSSTNIVFYANNGALLTGPAIVTGQAQRFFCEVVRKAGVTRLLVNGTQYGSGNTYPTTGVGGQHIVPAMYVAKVAAATKTGLMDLYGHFVERNIGVP